MQSITKIGRSNIQIDTIANRITFLDNRFYLSDEGQFIPSVTTILEAYPKGAQYYEWLKKNGEDADTIRDEAGRRGSIVHNLTEQFDNGELVSIQNQSGEVGFRLNEWAMFERYVNFRRRFPLDILHIEQNFVSPALGYAGTIDRVVEMNGKTILIDIKTSNTVYPSYWLQLAAYNKLLTESYGFNPIDEVAILWLNAKTRSEGKRGDIQGIGWQLITRSAEDQEKDEVLFNATHRLWLAENGSIRPKELSYSLNHKL